MQITRQQLGQMVRGEARRIMERRAHRGEPNAVGRGRDLDQGGAAARNDDETLRQAKLELGAAKGRLGAVKARLGAMRGTLGGRDGGTRQTINRVDKSLYDIAEMIDDCISALDDIDYA